MAPIQSAKMFFINTKCTKDTIYFPYLMYANRPAFVIKKCKKKKKKANYS